MEHTVLQFEIRTRARRRSIDPSKERRSALPRFGKRKTEKEEGGKGEKQTHGRLAFFSSYSLPVSEVQAKAFLPSFSAPGKKRKRLIW
jgi:hypothetical protein